MKIQNLATGCQLGPMILMTLVSWGPGDARTSAVESVLRYGEPQLALTHRPVVLQLGQMEKAKLGSCVWVLETQLRSPCLHSQDFTDWANPQFTIAWFYYYHENTSSWELRTGKTPEK